METQDKDTLFDLLEKMDITDEDSDALLLAYLMRLSALCVNLKAINKDIASNEEVKQHLPKGTLIKERKACNDMIDDTVNAIDSVVATIGMIKFEKRNNLGLLERDQNGNIKSNIAIQGVNKIASKAMEKVNKYFKEAVKEGTEDMEEKNDVS